MEVDYPKDWSSLVPDVLICIKNAEKPEQLYGSLVVAKALVSTYKRSMEQERAPLEFIIENLFPMLENLLVNEMIKNEAYSSRICQIILSIFCMANWMQFARYLNADRLRIWMVAIKTLLNRRISPELTIKLSNWDEMIKRAEDPEWKIKANCMKTVSR